jgi:hypothetical protein
MIPGEIRYINEFPQTFTLTNNIEPTIDLIGINDFYIHDSLMIFATRGSNHLWSFISLPNYTHLGDFLSRGDGPLEFVQPPRVSASKLYKENGSLFAGIYDFQKGRLLKMNISESLKKGELDITILTDSIPRNMFNFLMLDNDHFFCKEITNDRLQQIRYILKDGHKTTPTILEKMNQASVERDDDYNILSTIAQMNKSNEIIVEMPLRLNYINMYSLDGSFAKTICVSNKVDDIKEIQYKKRENRIYTFDNTRLFPDFWGAVYINESDKSYDSDKRKPSSIMLFDWQGEPLAKIKLNRTITSFDIDFINGHLYTLNFQSDEFYRYNIQDILTKLKVIQDSGL